MNCVAVIYKPAGLSSSDVVIKCRNALSKSLGKKIKCGHTGTLDPAAEGVLVLGFGKLTKLFDYVQKERKRYSAFFTFGKETDTFDREGAVVAENDFYPDIRDVRKAVKTFIGETEQIPPAYSAVNVNGVRAYKLARKGEEVRIAAKKVTIYSINIFSEYCEGDLTQPTFVMDYPIDMSPLVKRHRNNPELTERFELFVAGKELCNAYSELNDPIDQLERFQEQLRLSEKGDDEAMFIDMDFVRALEYGMPPTSGMGMGIDRLTMFMTNQQSIQDVLFFPQMKPEKGAVKDSVEKYEEKGIPAEWVPVLHKMGFTTVESLHKLSAGKLFNDLCGFNKKNKLGLKNPTADEVKQWVEE